MTPRTVGLLLAGTTLGLGAYGYATTTGRPMTRRLLRSVGMRAYLAAVGGGRPDPALLRSIERACDDDDHVVPYWGCGHGRIEAPTRETRQQTIDSDAVTEPVA